MFSQSLRNVIFAALALIVAAPASAITHDSLDRVLDSTIIESAAAPAPVWSGLGLLGKEYRHREAPADVAQLPFANDGGHITPSS